MCSNPPSHRPPAVLCQNWEAAGPRPPAAFAAGDGEWREVQEGGFSFMGTQCRNLGSQLGPRLAGALI